ncbi:MAG TPA: protein kinase [Holophagaceae bacterium]|nr:protein kinase [Holophagaceae bacterium]
MAAGKNAGVKWTRSLGWKFFIRTGLVILLLMGAVLGVALVQTRKAAQSSAADGLQSAAALLGRTFDQQAKVMDAGLEVFTQYSYNLAEIEKAEETQSLISVQDTLNENLPTFSGDVALIVRPDGKLLTSTEAAPGRSGFADVGIVQMAMAPEEAASEGFKGPSYRGFVELGSSVYFAVARRLTAPSGNNLGVMLVGTRLDSQQAASLRALALPKSAHLALLSRFKFEGDTFPDAVLRDQAMSALQSPAFAAAKASTLKGEVPPPVPLTLGGHDYLATLVPLRGANALDLQAAELLVMPLEPFLAPFNRLRLWILGAGAAGLLLALLVALVSARSVTAPLAHLTEATAALAEGRRPELPASGQMDEVGLLTDRFRGLMEELKAKEDMVAMLEQVRSAGAVNTRVAKDADMTVVDVDATVSLLGKPLPSPKRLTIKEGETFAGRYRVDGVLGKGGMGIVLKARDLQLDEEVAIKVIRPEHAVDADFLERLKQEVRLARRISHRFVLRTHDFAEADGVAFVTMEYLKGVTLKRLLDDRGKLPLPLVLRIGRQVAEGLEAAHAEGVVHRDIKPLNVLFDARGDVKLMDFGLAAPVSAAGKDRSGQVFGSPRYMAPEQVRGDRVDPRTDLYSLGVMLFELATGQPPFPGSDVSELLRKQLSAEPPHARDIDHALPSSFSFLLDRLLQKRMEDRPSGAAEVVEILKAIQSGGEAAETRRIA